MDNPWYMALFNTELLEQKKNQWEKEAKENGMSLLEYLDTKIIKLDEQKEETK